MSLVAEITSSSSVSLTNQLTSLLPGIIFLMRPSTFSLEVKFLVNCLRHFYFASEKNFFITKCYLLIVIGCLSFLNKKYASKHFFILMLSENANKETVFSMKCYWLLVFLIDNLFTILQWKSSFTFLLEVLTESFHNNLQKLITPLFQSI